MAPVSQELEPPTNPVRFTLVSGTPGANETQIGGDLDATLTALASDLNGSADVEIARCTYAADTGAAALTITHDTAGTGGNGFAVAVSANANGAVSSPTLIGRRLPARMALRQ